MLSSLIDVTSQSSSEEIEKKNNILSKFKQESNLQTTNETIKRFNKLRGTEYDLNISAEDQTAFLL